MTVRVGDKLSSAPASLTETAPDKTVQFPTEGKIIIVGVPGAYTPPCSDHVPTYILAYDDLLKKGIDEIYVVGVNDQFVMNAWGKHLTQQHGGDLEKLTHIHFCADRSGEFVKSLGLDFDASGLLGNTRSKRFALVVKDGIVEDVRVENSPPELTLTMADEVLKSL
ncbi:Redoxin [Terfezia boudieri ATCC MYA-4762]|uniref:Redoxin n=1 Tax=Terfezia boudieri ATCC MYA-4762 TaxID=1051890 RepID=A0A3N4LUP6_9PEZI|nr:Redoxin [Terfezia boudieri ATCC MYA-4762]